MIPVLIISPDNDDLTDLADRLHQENDITVRWADSGKDALEMISHDRIELVIVDQDLEDMTGLEFAEKLVQINPLINCAAISPLSHKEFHEASEGLGLMAQLPVHPDKMAAEELIKKIRKIMSFF